MRKSVKAALFTLAAGAIAGVVMRVTGWHTVADHDPVSAVLVVLGFACMMASFGMDILSPGKNRPGSVQLMLLSDVLCSLMAARLGHLFIAGALAMMFCWRLSVNAKLVGLIKYIKAGSVMPRFYGVAWIDWRTQGAYCAPLGLNVVISKIIALWLLAKHGWRTGHADGRAGYDQDRKDENALWSGMTGKK